MRLSRYGSLQTGSRQIGPYPLHLQLLSWAQAQPTSASPEAVVHAEALSWQSQEAYGAPHIGQQDLILPAATAIAEAATDHHTEAQQAGFVLGAPAAARTELPDVQLGLGLSALELQNSLLASTEQAADETGLQKSLKQSQLQRNLDAYAAVEFGNEHLGPSQGRLNETFRKEQVRGSKSSASQLPARSRLCI